MKIQCNVCEAAEANVLCCADEAALCWACDDKVHAANKLASKHQRIPLLTSQMPKCDICQESVGYFFCLEDRALLCRKCDLAIHSANTYVSAHQRFLLTGVKVGLEPVERGGSSSMGMLGSGEKIPKTEHRLVSQRDTPGENDKVLPVQVSGVSEISPTKLSFSGGSAAESISQWQLDDFLELSEFNQSYSCMNDGSSKADCGKLGGSDCSPILRATEEEFNQDECLGQVPETSWMVVPEVPSPPTASGLYWPRNPSDHAAFVPDIYCSPVSDPHHFQPNAFVGSKRRRQF